LSKFIPATLNFIVFPPVFLDQQFHGSRREINYLQRFPEISPPKIDAFNPKNTVAGEIFRKRRKRRGFAQKKSHLFCCGKGSWAGINL
jgi:hypothetical protein